MLDKLSNIECHNILDDVLRILQGTGYDEPLDYYELFKKLNIELPKRDRRIIIDKLISDGYIKFLNNKIQPEKAGYFITFKGLFFYKKGGYKKQSKRDTISENLQITTTLVMVVGTCLAGLYTLIHFFSWLYPLLFPSFCRLY